METPQEEKVLVEEPVSRLEQLTNELSQTNKILKAYYSWKSVILRGLLTGVTVVVGSTIIAGLLFSLLRFAFGDIPFIPSL